MNGVMEFHNEALGVQIRTILNEDGSISMNAEDTAIGFGWIDKSKFATSGEMYVRWARINIFQNLDFRNKLRKMITSQKAYSIC